MELEVVEGAVEDLRKKFRLGAAGVVLIGRMEVDFQVSDPTVSRLHLCIEGGEQGQSTVHDLKSTAGTFFKVGTAGAQLRVGDTVQVGRCELIMTDLVYGDGGRVSFALDWTKTPIGTACDADKFVFEFFSFDEVVTIGRTKNCDIYLSCDMEISLMHAEISFQAGKLFIRDSNSKNGTWKKIVEPFPITIASPDLKLGTTILRVREADRIFQSCCVCLDLEVQVVLAPCGHLCLCIKCSDKISRCPICRRFVKEVIRCFPS